MTTDRYTKAVLTIIAAALLYIGAMLSGQPASAQSLARGAEMFIEPSRPQAVVVVGWGTVRSDGQVFVNTVRDAAGGTRTDATLPVALQATRQQPLPVAIQQGGQPLAVSLGVTTQRPLPVAITSVRAVGEWDPIRTKVENQPLTRNPGPP
jgi:hypothetical protein